MPGNGPENPPVVPTPPTQVIVGQLREFQLNVSDWTLYKPRLQNYFLANGINDEAKKKAILLNMLDEEAYKLVFNLCSPTPPESKGFENLLQIFDDHFTPQKAVFAERYKFYEAKKSPTESVKEWAAKVRSLAVPCEFQQELEVILRDKFICGFEPGGVLDRMLEEKTTISFENAVRIAENKVVSQENCQHISGSSRQIKTEFNHLQGRGSKEVVSRERGKYNAAAKSKRESEGQKSCCRTCGKNNHTQDKCFFKNHFCHICNIQGHLANMCFKKKHKTNKFNRHNFLETGNSVLVKDHDELNLFSVNALKGVKPFQIELIVENKPMIFHIDSGASISVISDDIYKKYFSSIKLKPSDKFLYFYNGLKVKPLGVVELNVTYQKLNNKIEFYVLENGGPPIVGRDFLNMYNIGFAINFVDKNDQRIVSNLSQEFKEVFSEGLGTFNKGVASIKLKDLNYSPKFYRARPVPYAIKSQVEQEINRLLNLGVISPVDYSEWATPVVPVLKKNGSVRLCGDFKVTINPLMEVDQYPLPRIEDLFVKLQGGKLFSKLDLSQAYQQVRVNEASRERLTVSTHLVLFRYNRLPFGVACAPAKFQKIME